MPLIFAPLLIPGLVFFSVLVLFALSNTTNAWLGSGDAADTGGFGGWLKTALRQSIGGRLLHLANVTLRSTISRWALARLRPVTRWFTALAGLAFFHYTIQGQFASSVAHAIERLRHHTIPHEAAKAAAPAKAQARTAQRSATRANTHATATSKALTHYSAKTNTTLRHHSHALDVTLPRELAGFRRREEALSRDQTKLRERTNALESGAIRTFQWIRTHPLSAATGVFAGAVAVALARLGFGFLRCRNWQRFGRRITCGMGALLEDLIFGAFTALAVSDLCRFADGMDTLARQLQPLFMQLVDAEDALIGCHGATKPDPLSLPRLYLPPVPDPLPLG